MKVNLTKVDSLRSAFLVKPEKLCVDSTVPFHPTVIFVLFIVV